MTRVHAENTRIYVNEFNLSGRANNLDLTIENPAADTTAYEDPADTAVQGKSPRGWMAHIDAWFDPDTDEIDQILFDLVDAQDLLNPWGFYFNGPAAGSHGYEGLGGVNRDNIQFPLNAAGQLRADVRGDSGQMIGRAMKVREADVVTGVEDGGSVQHEAMVTGDRIISVVRLIAVTGGPGSITLVAEESVDDAAWAAIGDLPAHPAFTALGADSRTAVLTGGIGAFYRHRVSAFSGFTDATVRTAIAIVDET